MGVIKRYDVEITMVKKNVIAESAADAINLVQEDIQTKGDIIPTRVVVERTGV